MYSTLTVTDVNDLAIKIADFMVVNCGFVLQQSAADATYPSPAGSWRVDLRYGAAGRFVSFHSQWPNNLFLLGSNNFMPAGYLGYGAPWAGIPAGTFAFVSGYATFPGAQCHLFGGPGWCFAVVKDTAATTAYKMFGVGAITKACTFTGGDFICTHDAEYVQADVDGNVGLWVSTVKMMHKSNYDGLRSYAPIAVNNVTPLLPATVDILRTGGLYSHLGITPHVKLFGSKGQYAQGDVVTSGGLNWMMFDLPRYGANYPGLGFEK